jgi:hypothetical protein
MKHLPDGSPVKIQFRRLGVEVRHLKEVHIPGLSKKQLRHDEERLRSLQRLQVWTMTDFDKIVWLESDSIVYRSLDWLFTREWMWSARNDTLCNMNSETPSLGMLLLHPSLPDFRGLVEHAGNHLLDSTYSDVVASYFAKVRKRPIRLLSEVEADYGQCLGNRIPTPYRNNDGTPVTGSWSTPAFVHRSGGMKFTWYEGQKAKQDDNMCFSLDLSHQKYPSKGRILNICHYHPLSAYWRDAFCEAATKVLDIKVREVNAFCTDSCYYEMSGSACVDAAVQLSGPVP